MKYNQFKYILLGLVSMCFIACTQDDEDIFVPEYTKFENPNWKATTGPVPVDAPTNWTTVFSGGIEVPNWNVMKPTPMARPDWVNPDMHVYPSSMTAIICMSDYIKPDMTDKDLLGAFINNECRGLGTTITNSEGETLYLVQIKAAQSEMRKVEFRYFSDKKKEVFVAESGVSFESDKTLGSVDNPFSTTWDSKGELPYYMDMDVTIDISSFDQGAVAEDDLVAAFVGNECRGLGKAVRTDEGFAFKFRTWAREASEELTLHYYTSDLKDIYVYGKKCAFHHTEEVKVNAALNEHGYMDMYVRLPEEVRPYMGENDNLAAFVNGQPCSIIQNRVNDSFQLKMKGSKGDQVSFQYYCAELNHIFSTKDCASYEDASSWGNEGNYNVLPLKTDFQLVTMNATFAVEEYKAINTELAEGDILAAFVGDECRGVAYGEIYDDSLIFDMKVRGTLGVDEQFTLQYYHIDNQYKFTCKKIFDFKAGGAIGERNLPMGIKLHVVE